MSGRREDSLGVDLMNTNQPRPQGRNGLWPIMAAMLVFTTLMAAWPAMAQDATRSVITTIDLKTCTVLRTGPDGSAWRCVGLPGYPVYVADGDDRRRAVRVEVDGDVQHAVPQHRRPEAERKALGNADGRGARRATGA